MWCYFQILTSLEKSHIPVRLLHVSHWLRCVLMGHAVRQSQPEVARPFHNSSLCLCMTAPCSHFHETVWHQLYCMLTNLRISTAFRHSIPPRAWLRVCRETPLMYAKLALVINIQRSPFSDTLCLIFSRSFSDIWWNAASRHMIHTQLELALEIYYIR